MLDAPAKGVRGANGRGRGRGKDKAGPSPCPPIPDDSITQSVAKSLLPPGAPIWRGAAKGMWWVHLPPLPRRREPWMPQGMGQACRGALRYAGYQSASRHGLCDSDRTTRGLCLTDSGRIEHAG